jgi:hypothetical protein
LSVQKSGAVKADGSPLATVGNFHWLFAFQSDGARLAAIAMVCATLAFVYCFPIFIKEWVADRRDRRADELKKLTMMAKRVDNPRHAGKERSDRDA